MTDCEEEPTFAGEIPSVSFQFISEIIVQKRRTPSVEAIIFDEIYKGEYNEPTINPLVEMELHIDDDQGSYQGEHNVQNQDRNESTFGIPILDTARDIVMKNIPPLILPQFHGIPTKGPNAFCLNLIFYVGITIIIKMETN